MKISFSDTDGTKKYIETESVTKKLIKLEIKLYLKRNNRNIKLYKIKGNPEIGFYLKNSKVGRICEKYNCTEKYIYEKVVENNDPESLKVLLLKNIPMSVDYFCISPLNKASREGKVDLVKIFLENNVPTGYDLTRLTPINSAASEGHLEVVKCLIEKSCLAQRDLFGRTPLDNAIKNKHIKIAEFIKKYMEKNK